LGWLIPYWSWANHLREPPN